MNKSTYWENVEGYPIEEWRAEVKTDETRLGYMQWVQMKQDLKKQQRKPELTPQQYAEKRGARCPFCESTELQGESIEVEDGAAFQRVGCLDCEGSWVDVYKLEGYDSWQG